MSYGQFLVVFLVLPIVVLGIALRRRLSARYLRSLAILALVAFTYTTPWDNLIVALGVWTYDRSLIAGIIIGYVPLEEYLFYGLQTILTGLLLLALRRSRVPRWEPHVAPDHRPERPTRGAEPD